MKGAYTQMSKKRKKRTFVIQMYHSSTRPFKIPNLINQEFTFWLKYKNKWITAHSYSNGNPLNLADSRPIYHHYDFVDKQNRAGTW